jgi:hypothetical protein
MKREGGINGRDDKSSGIDIRMADALAKINPTDPLISMLFVFFNRATEPFTSLGMLFALVPLSQMKGQGMQGMQVFACVQSSHGIRSISRVIAFSFCSPKRVCASGAWEVIVGIACETEKR